MNSSRIIPFFNYQQVFAKYHKKYIELFEDVMNRGAYIMQDDLRKFEENLEKYLGVKHAIGIANCTDALCIALLAAGIGDGDEVIFPSHTMVASPSAIYFARAKPIPVDCDDDHLINPEAVKRAITRKTKAIMPVQLNGRVADMDSIREIAAEYKLKIIEDAAQSLGAKFNGQFAGTFGAAAAFSFYPAKLLGCMGDGGALVTNNDDIAEKAMLYRDHGRNDDGEVVLWGMNSRLDNLQAAILDFQFKDYEKAINKRRSLAMLYTERLNHISELKLPPAPEDGLHFDVFQNYEIEAENRDDLKKHLKERGVGTLIQWGGKAVHQFSALGFDVELPRTDKLFRHCLMLPMNTTLDNDDINFICDSIEEFYG